MNQQHMFETAHQSLENSSVESISDLLGQGPQKEAQLFYLTNRRNLISILTGGIIGPRSIHQTYVDDLQSYCADLIPLTNAPVSCDVVPLVSPTDRPDVFPVLLELNQAVLHRPRVSALTEQGDQISSHVVGEPGALWWAAPGMIPLTAVRAIHFQDSSHCKEHQARRFGNTVDLGIPLIVSPHLFSRSLPMADALRGWMAGLPEGPESDVDFGFVDRIAGAMCGAVIMAQNGYDLMGHVPADTFFRLFSAFHDGSFTASKDVSVIARQLIDLLVPETKHHHAEHILLWSVMECLRQTDPSGWTSASGVADITSRVADASQEDKVLIDIVGQLDRIGQVLRNERVFEGFKSAEADFRTTRALLLFGLRPKLSALVGFDDPIDLNSTTYEMMLAGFMAGFLAGRRRLESAYRSDSIERFIVESIPCLMYGAGDSVLRPHTHQTQLVLDKQEDGPSFDRVFAIKSGDNTIYAHDRMERLRRVLTPRVLETEAGLRVGMAIAKRLRFFDVLRVTAAPDASGRGGEAFTVGGVGDETNPLNLNGFFDLTIALDVDEFRNCLERATDESGLDGWPFFRTEYSGTLFKDAADRRDFFEQVEGLLRWLERVRRVSSTEDGMRGVAWPRFIIGK